MPTIHRIGVILAAGRGRRMGRTKQLIPWQTPEGDKPLVAATYDAILPICDGMVLVLGHEGGAVAAALGERTFHRAEGNPDAPMFESIRAGILAARAVESAATIVLQPADHPEVSRETLDSLVRCSLDRPAQAIIPQHAGRGGHPVLIPPVVAALLVQSDCSAGLGDFWSTHADLCHRLPVDDASILRDVDTPSDLPH